MALNQFGAVLTFAIGLENQLAAFYQAAGLGDRAQVAKNNAEQLEKSRRQNVVEITLEPIEGLDEADYVWDLSGFSPHTANAAQALMARFYEDITPKINVLETRQVLKRCLKDHKKLPALAE
jgi:hypothetical protein